MIRKGIIRLLCGIIDYVIVMIPVQFIMMGLFRVSSSQADLLFKLLFAVYGVLFLEYMGGRTPGKFFGQITVVEMGGGKPPMLYGGLRELFKTLYFIPYVGWVLGAVSAVMLFAGKGRALHDYVGRTEVVYVWQKEEMADENGV